MVGRNPEGSGPVDNKLRFPSAAAFNDGEPGMFVELAARRTQTLARAVAALQHHIGITQGRPFDTAAQASDDQGFDTCRAVENRQREPGTAARIVTATGVHPTAATGGDRIDDVAR